MATKIREKNSATGFRMLMLAIISWDRDLVFQQIESFEKAKELRRRIGSEDQDFIVYEFYLLCPIKMDHAIQEQSEEDIIEWFKGEVLPKLYDEGRIDMKNGKYVSKKRNKVIRA
jgi:hypothetical protein